MLSFVEKIIKFFQSINCLLEDKCITGKTQGQEHDWEIDSDPVFLLSGGYFTAEKHCKKCEKTEKPTFMPPFNNHPFLP